MAWMKFTKDFDFSPADLNGHVTVAYKADTTVNVTRECADQALALGRAEETSAPAKEDANPAPAMKQAKEAAGAETTRRG